MGNLSGSNVAKGRGDWVLVLGINLRERDAKIAAAISIATDTALSSDTFQGSTCFTFVNRNKYAWYLVLEAMRFSGSAFQ